MERMEKRTDFYDCIDKIQRQDRYINELEEENKRLQSENDKQKTELDFYKQSKIIDNETLQIRQKEKMRYKEILDRIKELYEYEEEAELLNYLDEILDEI